MCSRAIMLVTDGATEMYDDVFEKYNWPERKVRYINLNHTYTCTHFNPKKKICVLGTLDFGYIRCSRDRAQGTKGPEND